MKTDYEKTATWQDKKLLQIIDPHCYKFNDVAGLMRNCLTQHDIIHALLKILKDEFHCHVEANTRYDGESRFILNNLTYSVDIPKIETNVYMIKDYNNPLNVEKVKEDD